jgi:hypothetical protein
VTITVPIDRVSPLPDGTSYTLCSLYTPGSLPAFAWNPLEPFISYEVQFSSDQSFKSIPARIKAPKGALTLTPTVSVWKIILSISGKSGGPVYWRVVGTRVDKTIPIATSEIGFIMIDSPHAAEINTPLDGATIPGATPPTFDFNSNCNIKFRLEFSPISNFSDPKKVIGFAYTIANPVTQAVVNWTLNCFQWNAVKKLVGTGGYFRMKAWDAINRETVSEVRSFSIQFSLIGTWDITGTLRVTVTIPGYGSETEVVDVYDEFTFNPDGTFKMTGMTGKWTQCGKFTVYLSASDVERDFERTLRAELGTSVNVSKVRISFTGKENDMDDTISGTVTFTMNMSVSAYGITGATVKAIVTFKGTRLLGSPLLMLEGVPPKKEELFLTTIGRELNKIIRARRQL